MNLTIYKILLVIAVFGAISFVFIVVPYPSLAYVLNFLLFLMLGALVSFPGKRGNPASVVFLQKVAYPFALVYQRIHILLLRISRVSPALIDNERLRLKSIQRFPYDLRCEKELDHIRWLAEEKGWVVRTLNETPVLVVAAFVQRTLTASD